MTARARRAIAFTLVALVAAALTLLLTRDRLPHLDRARLDDARARWRAAGVHSYDMTYFNEGSELRRGEFSVGVRVGSPIRVARDGIVVSGDSSAYSVDGLLDSLAQELELVEDPSRTLGAAEGYHAYLYARFDELGVPRRFRRVVGGGRSRWVEWTVTSFDASP